MKKNEGRKKIKFKVLELGFVLIIFVILIVILMTKDSRNLKAHCKNAICNEKKTICYTYGIDKKGNTYKSWSGSCAKK